MHPHGVKYTPEYDGAYIGRVHARRRLRRARARSSPTVGVHAGLGRRVAVPRPRAQPHAQHVPRAVRRDRSSAPKGAKWPDVEHMLFLHQLLAAGDRPGSATSSASTGAAHAGNTPTMRARVGQDVAIHAIGMDSNFHTFHIHGHRWRDPRGGVRRQPRASAPTRPSPRASSRTTRAAGSTTATSSPTRTRAWPAGTWSTRKPRRRRNAASLATSSLGLAAALALPAARGRADLSGAQGPGQGRAEAEGPAQDLHGVQARLRLPQDPEGRRQGEGRRHGPRSSQRHLPRGGEDQRRQEGATCSSSATPRTRARSLLDGRGNKGQNGIFVNGADEVTIDGFMARNYKGNGFFVTTSTATR